MSLLMKKSVSNALIVTLILIAGQCLVNASESPDRIIGGKLVMAEGDDSLSGSFLKTERFLAESWVSAGGNSRWTVCGGPASVGPTCQMSTTFQIPINPIVVLGFCGPCEPPQFPRGTFVINGQKYEDIYFSGNLTFSQSAVTVNPFYFVRRKGITRITRPFTVSGTFEACETPPPSPCTPGNKLYSSKISGQGTVYMTFENKWSESVSLHPYLKRVSLEYRFESPPSVE